MKELTLQCLEYYKIKQRVMEYAVSYLGREKIENMQPMTQYTSVKNALYETAEALEILKTGASVPVPSLEGIEMVLNLLGTGYVFSEQEFYNIHRFLHSCTQLKKYMAAKSSIAPKVSSLAFSLNELNTLKSEIERCIRNGKIIDAASNDLNKIRKKITVVEDRIKSKIDTLMTKHRTILQEYLVSMRDNRYVLPVKKEHQKKVKGSVLDESASGQTVYIEPYEINELQYKITELRSEESREELKVLSYLSGLIMEGEHQLRINVETVGIYDFLFAKAKYALSIGGRNVELSDKAVIDVRGARHPLLGHGTTPLYFSIGTTYKAIIITGPNTGGKTVALKTIGLLTLMVQSGLLIPVEESSIFSVFTKLAVDIGDGQSIEQSLSTFSSHIKNVIDILNHADNSTLVLIDELASGTDPGEGVGLSIAILEELHSRGTTLIATTHFNEIKNFASLTPGFENARMEFDRDTLQPLYQLRIGEAGQSYAFIIAQKLGISSEIVRRSQEITEGRRLKENCRGAKVAEHQCTVIGKKSDTQLDVSEEHLITSQENEKKSLDREVKPSELSTKTLNAEETCSDGTKQFEIGDSVYVSYLKTAGIVYEKEDTRGNVGVIIQKEKFKINKKRLTLHIEKKELYPDNYDFDVIFETKENRKKKKTMNRKHVEGLNIIEKPKCELE